MKSFGTIRVEVEYLIVRDDNAGISYRYSAVHPDTHEVVYSSSTIEGIKSLITTGYPERRVYFGSPIKVAKEIERAKS